ncbi:MAG: hypothetical protein H6R44_355 [Nitrospirae bacterium]|nr:hypothetical protein [Nitrospirota bacterium]
MFVQAATVLNRLVCLDCSPRQESVLPGSNEAR